MRYAEHCGIPPQDLADHLHRGWPWEGWDALTLARATAGRSPLVPSPSTVPSSATPLPDKDPRGPPERLHPSIPRRPPSSPSPWRKSQRHPWPGRQK
jgi:hypothetical protein